METEGEFGVVLRGAPKVVLWTRLSRDLCDLLSDFIAGKRVYLHPCSAEVYGNQPHPSLPALTALDGELPEQPSWCPTVIRLVPAPGTSSRLARVARIRLTRR
jgi:hypothetical protein